MSRRTQYLFFASVLTLLEILIFAAIAGYFYHEIISRSAFRFPYSVFFMGLVRGYWWIPATTIPLFSWGLARAYELRKDQRNR